MTLAGGIRVYEMPNCRMVGPESSSSWSPHLLDIRAFPIGHGARRSLVSTPATFPRALELGRSILSKVSEREFLDRTHTCSDGPSSRIRARTRFCQLSVATKTSRCHPSSVLFSCQGRFDATWHVLPARGVEKVVFSFDSRGTCRYAFDRSILQLGRLGSPRLLPEHHSVAGCARAVARLTPQPRHSVGGACGMTKDAHSVAGNPHGRGGEHSHLYHAGCPFFDCLLDGILLRINGLIRRGEHSAHVVE